MIASAQLDSLAKKLCAALPESIQALEKDLQQSFKDILMSAFSRIDLVTREEFDVQTKVLAKTRKKIDALQAQLDSLLSTEEN